MCEPNNNSNYNNSNNKRGTWGFILKIIITVATAIAGVLGIQSCSN
ncbi:smalltalk protein [uncultured Bacteroides sp.]|jgi:hypothetical protein|nr:smalltalk protein [uncultured Bacteroides sp.]